jgi:hypothetical protein
MLIPIYIDGVLYYLKNEISILEACRSVGAIIPRFCYHENLSIAGNCRMCLVEVHEVIKPVVACSTDILENMIIYTNSPLVLKARENILEFLLLNHPLDCPICDQAGECDLQDQSIFFGNHFSRSYLNKRGVEDKNIGHIIKTIMTRCIHCTKCVRFGEEVCGVKFFGTLNRGTNTEIGSYLLKLTTSEVSANVIDLCPVGALTLKTIPFQIRPWEIQLIDSIDLSDSFGSNIYLNYRGLDLFRIVPKKNKFINESWISNKARFYHELMVKKSSNFIFSKFISDNFINKSNFSSLLFIFNPDLDLKTLYYLKQFSSKYNKISAKLLNSTVLKSNYYIWNNKPQIAIINKNCNFTFFFLVLNTKIESPILNIRLKSQLKSKGNAFGFGCFYTSNFPIQFSRFSILDIIYLLKGTHPILFNNLNIKSNIFFANKALLNRIDSTLINYFSLKKIKLYLISSFCNSESANLLNFKTYNLKEILFSKFIFGLSLDDTYLIRKLIKKMSYFFWVNQFPSNILTFLPLNSWINLEINQLPGFYLNLEQRIQKYSLLYSSNYTLHKFLFSIKSLLSYSSSKMPKFKFFFLQKFFIFLELKEMFFKNIIINAPTYFSFFFFSNPSFLIYKKLPVKLSIEDPYRTSLQLKYSRTLIKSSQLLRSETTNFL